MPAELAPAGRVAIESRKAPAEPVPLEYACRAAIVTERTTLKGDFYSPLGRQFVGTDNMAGTLPTLVDG